MELLSLVDKWIAHISSFCAALDNGFNKIK